MAGEPQPEPAVELLSDEDRESPGRGWARRPWVWAVCGVVAASAVWAGTLRVTDYGHTPAPDLHGFHLADSPCTSANLEPLTDAVSAGGFTVSSPSIRKGPALDHISCGLTSSVPLGDGWATAYAVLVSVELHKKSDPRAEFQSTYDTVVSSPTVETLDDFVVWPDESAVPTVYPGLGDLAYFTGAGTYQSLSVLYGGVVLSLTLDAHHVWQGDGKQPTTADGDPQRPYLADTTALRPLIVQTTRHLMSVLSQ